MKGRRHSRSSTAGSSDDWLITYADTVTLLLCVFVVLLAVRGGGLRFVRPVQPSPVMAPAPVFPPPPIVVVPFRESDVVGQTSARQKAESRRRAWGVGDGAPHRIAESPAERVSRPALPRYATSDDAAGPLPIMGRTGVSRAGDHQHRRITAVPAAARREVAVLSDAALARGARVPDDHALLPPRPSAGEPPGNRIVIFQCSDTAFFSSGSAVLSDAGKHNLMKLLVTLRAPKFAGYRITVEGHTDDEPIRDAAFPSNWELSAARAASVVRFLVEQGVARDRLRAVGYADTRPLAPNRDAAGNPIPANQMKNRRVVVELEKIERAPTKPRP